MKPGKPGRPVVQSVVTDPAVMFTLSFKAPLESKQDQPVELWDVMTRINKVGGFGSNVQTYKADPDYEPGKKQTIQIAGSQGFFEFKVAGANKAGAGVASKTSNPKFVGGERPRWSFGEAPEGHLGFYTLFDPTNLEEDPTPVSYFHMRDGGVWSHAAQGYLASHAKDPELLEETFPTAYPPKVTKSEPVRTGKWDINVDLTGNLIFSKDLSPVTCFTTSGKVWTEEEEGFLMGTKAIKLNPNATTEQPSHSEKITEERDATLAKVFDDPLGLVEGTVLTKGNWKLGEHQSGALAFIYKDVSRSGKITIKVIAVLTQMGEWWTASEQSIIGRKSFALRTLEPLTSKVQLTEEDCGMTQWSQWNQCNRQCGVGTESRERLVVVPPRFGGSACGQLLEVRQCNSAPCTCAAVKLRSIGSTMQLDSNSDAVYFWYLSKFILLDTSTGKVLEGPLETSESPQFSMLDAPFNFNIIASFGLPSSLGRGDGLVMLTNGQQWSIWSNVLHKSIASPEQVEAEGWRKHLPAPFSAMVDAALNSKLGEWQDADEVTLFSGRYWMRYSLRTFKTSYGPFLVEDFPFSLTLSAPLNTRIDSAFNIAGTASDAYIFSGEEYARWDFIRDEVLEAGKLPDVSLFATVIGKLGVCEMDL